MFALVLLGQPILWTAVFLLVALICFRRGRKAGDAAGPECVGVHPNAPWRAQQIRPRPAP